ncbi:MAG: tyrosine-type recombinase/integrase, partial [Desulfovibrionaceae bacterium]
VWKQRGFKDELTARAFDIEMLPTEKDDRLSLGDLVQIFYKARRDISRETKKKVVYFLWGYVNTLNVHHAGRGLFLTDKYAEELTRRDLQMMRDAMLTTGASPTTCNKMQAYIRAILAWGVENEYIRYNPWRECKRLKTERPQIEVDFQAFQRVYQQLPEYWQWAAQTAFFLCLRPGKVELFGLLWTAFDWRKGIVRVRQGKSGNIKIVYPHHEYMARALERYEKDTAAGIVYVCHRDGLPVTSYRTAWVLACKRAGAKMRPYDIRHLAATMQLSAGADVAAVAAQLGHSTPSTTLNNYIHTTAANQQRAANLMPQIDLMQLGAGFEDKK